MTWSANNSNVTITGTGASVTVTGVTDGTSTITANYNNGEVIKTIDVNIQNKWAQRGITNVQFGSDKIYYCDETQTNGLGSDYGMYFSNDGSYYLGNGLNSATYMKRDSNEIDQECTFSTNRIDEGDEYYIFKGTTIDIRLEDDEFYTFTATLQ